jgi:tRNA pseudouridine55 synthase
VRRALRTRRVGHTGTLDPFATGVLPVCVGKATRLARFLAEGEKVYEATLGLGFATTTDDLTGEQLGEARPAVFTPSEVNAACRSFVGEIAQIPPAFSAKRVEGHRLYELARKGEAVVPAPVRVRVDAIEVRSVKDGRLELEVRCSPGTYVRALARDLGRALGCGGHLVALRRTRSGGLGLERAVTGDAIGPDCVGRLLPLRDCLADLPAVEVSEEGMRAVRHGRDLPRALVTRGFPEWPPPQRLRLLDDTGELVALALPEGFGPSPGSERVEPTLHPDVVLLG